ncbi:MAG: hypothetical protein WAV41_05385 [Microgenomates group bacterium]
MKQKLDYLLVFLLFSFGFCLYLYFSYNGHLQRNVIYVTGGLYFLWSLWHHYRLGDLHLSIIIEYLAIISLGLLVLSSTFVF